MSEVLVIIGEYLPAQVRARIHEQLEVLNNILAEELKELTELPKDEFPTLADLLYKPCDDYRYYDEPLPRPPKSIGIVQAGHSIWRRINRLLPIGHRWRGDVA